MKLSIIIPVYNVQNTLVKCVESILRQGVSDYELILIDDGSTDGSAALCDHLGADYKDVVIVYHQPNGGLSEARNKGIELSCGEYITFVDSDDFVGTQTYPQLMQLAEDHPEYDVVEFPVVEHYGNTHRQRLLSFEEVTYTDVQDYWLRCKAYRHTYVWNKIYRRRLYDDVRFPRGKSFEDALTYPRLLACAKHIHTTSCGLYYYCFNPKGITSKASGEDLRNLLAAHLSILPTCHDADYYAQVLNIQLDVYEKTGDAPLLPRLPYYNTPKLMLLKLIGLKRLCQLNKIIHKIYRTR